MKNAVLGTLATEPRRGTVIERGDPSRVIGRMTLDEYYAFERTATDRHELINGDVICMAGGSPEHNRICFDTGRALAEAIDQLHLDGEVFGGDQKVYINDDLVLYPDVSIVVGEAQFDEKDALRNPFAIVEVLSPSTAAFDTTRKFAEYHTIPSLQHYVLIDQHRVAVIHYAKISGNLWAIVGDHVQIDDKLSLMIEDVEIAVPITAVYRRVALLTP